MCTLHAHARVLGASLLVQQENPRCLLNGKSHSGRVVDDSDGFNSLPILLSGECY